MASRLEIEAIVREVMARLRPGGAAGGEGAAPPSDGAVAPGDEGTGAPRDPGEVFRSPEAARARREIARAARKLWLREYVDGNGGNISCRLSGDYVLCTPTLMSKADVRRDDIVMVDLAGRQVAGKGRHSSEITLHLAVMRAVPGARAVIHCHPPHATAYALTGRVPPEGLLAEPEVFLGPIGWVPYQTPGSQAVGDVAAAVARRHSTLLLANHGVACWADTVSHAEWYVEILEASCRTLMLAAGLGVPIVPMPRAKLGELLALKRRLGLPDLRYDLAEEALGARVAAPGSAIAVLPDPGTGIPLVPSPGAGNDDDRLVAAITDQVLAALAGDAGLGSDQS